MQLRVMGRKKTIRGISEMTPIVWSCWILISLSAAGTIVNFLRLNDAFIFSSGSENRRKESDVPHDASSYPSITNDGLVWVTPKPVSVQAAGWEDSWMMEWKRAHYSPDRRSAGCNRTDDSPYSEDLLCSISGYVPARLRAPQSRGRPHIPRVIFVSWLERRLGRAMYTSLLTLLHHNPEYELVFFTDEDVDQFVCVNVGSSPGDFALPLFSKVRAGAMRTDIWRLLIMQKYGGVYLDSDISSLGKLPLEWGDTAVSGVGCWSHLPGGTGGVLEHWAMAFAPNHPFVNEAVAALRRNLEHPEYLMRDDTPEAAAEESVTIRLTGPAVYQHVLHKILEKSKCERIDDSYCNAMFTPERHCKDMDTFRSFFPAGLRLLRDVNLDNALTHKIFHTSSAWARETDDMQYDYDDVKVRLGEADLDFCGQGAFAARAKRRAQLWEEKAMRSED